MGSVFGAKKMPGSKAPFCPLCHKRMERKYVTAPAPKEKPSLLLKPVVQPLIEVFACDRDRVAIRVNDPFCGQWDKALERSGKIECPNCNAAMRYFATSTGYMKCVCPKCKTETTASEPDRTESNPHTPDKPGVAQ